MKHVKLFALVFSAFLLWETNGAACCSWLCEGSTNPYCYAQCVSHSHMDCRL